MVDLNKVEEGWKEKFLTKIAESQIQNTSERASGFHVSALSYGCVRKVFREILEEERIEKMESVEKAETLHRQHKEQVDKYINEDRSGLYMVWIGSKLHETPITSGHEWGVEDHFMLKDGKKSYTLTGHIDEIYVDENGDKWIVDKKFVRYAPKEAMQPHHKKQVGFYAALLRNQGIVVKGVILSYFKVENIYRFKRSYETTLPDPLYIFVEEFSKTELDGYEKEIKRMIHEAMKSLESDKMPKGTVTWYCNYCPFKKDCGEDGTIIMDDNGKVKNV